MQKKSRRNVNLVLVYYNQVQKSMQTINEIQIKMQ